MPDARILPFALQCPYSSNAEELSPPTLTLTLLLSLPLLTLTPVLVKGSALTLTLTWESLIERQACVATTAAPIAFHALWLSHGFEPLAAPPLSPSPFPEIQATGLQALLSENPTIHV